MAKTNTKISTKALKSTMWRHACTLEWTNNYERLQASGFAYSMAPVLRELYDTDEEICTNLERHLRLYNTHPSTSAPIIGAVCALEEDYQTDTADSLKVALMGPMAGIGDTLHATLLQPLAFLFSAGLAAENSWLCIPVMLFPFFILWYIRFPLFKFGYKRSVSMINDISGKSALGKIRELASVVGVMVAGGFVPSMVNIKLKYAFTTVVNEVESKVLLQDTLDGILPNLLSMLVVALCYYLLKHKRMKPTTVMLVLSVVAFILGFMGII